MVDNIKDVLSLKYMYWSFIISPSLPGSVYFGVDIAVSVNVFFYGQQFITV